MVQAYNNSLWLKLQCSKRDLTAIDCLIDTNQIVELFCRKETPATMAEKHEDHHIVR